MPLTVQAYPGRLRGLGENLLDGLDALSGGRELAAAFVDRELMLTGPFPVYVAPPEAILEEAGEAAIARFRHTGWRAPISANGEAVALIEVTIGDEGEELYTVRPREAGRAFETLLRQALRLIESPVTFDVRWLSVPDIYVSALWLAGERQLFLPTRLGSAERVDSEPLSWPALRERMLPLIDAARPGAEFLERDAGSPRSGLPQ